MKPRPLISLLALLLVTGGAALAAASRPHVLFIARDDLHTKRWRLIAQSRGGAAPRMELFAFERDADETRNHAAAHPEVGRELLARLQSVPDPAPAVAAAKKKR